MPGPGAAIAAAALLALAVAALVASQSDPACRRQAVGWAVIGMLACLVKITLLQQSLLSTEGLLAAPHSGHGGGSDLDDEQAAANPTDFLLILMPVFNDQGPQGVVEVFQRPGARPATQRGYLKFLEQTCELAGDYLRSRRLRRATLRSSAASSASSASPREGSRGTRMVRRSGGR